MLTAALWYVLAAGALIAAALAAFSRVRDRRQAALGGVVGATTGLLLVLGADLAALAWLGLGALLARLPVDRRTASVPAAGELNPPRASLGRLVAILPAIGLGVLLAAMVWSVDWRDLPPPAAWAAQAAETGGRLATVDLGLLLGAGLLLAALLAAAAWLLVRPTTGRKEP